MRVYEIFMFFTFIHLRIGFQGVLHLVIALGLSLQFFMNFKRHFSFPYTAGLLF